MYTKPNTKTDPTKIQLSQQLRDPAFFLIAKTNPIKKLGAIER